MGERVRIAGSVTPSATLVNAPTARTILTNPPGKVLREGAKVTCKTTAQWASIPNYTPEFSEIIVYMDYATIDGNNVPGIKVGDGATVVGSLEFVGADFRQFIEDLGLSVVSGQLCMTYTS